MLLKERLEQFMIILESVGEKESIVADLAVIGRHLFEDATDAQPTQDPSIAPAPAPVADATEPTQPVDDTQPPMDGGTAPTVDASVTPSTGAPAAQVEPPKESKVSKEDKTKILVKVAQSLKDGKPTIDANGAWVTGADDSLKKEVEDAGISVNELVSAYNASNNGGASQAVAQSTTVQPEPTLAPVDASAQPAPSAVDQTASTITTPNSQPIA